MPLVLAAAILALAALFADLIFAFSAIVVGLFFSHWLDYGHIGFFGKLVAYPAVLTVAGLALLSFQLVSLDRMASLMLVAAAAGTFHAGPATALLIFVIVAPALLADAFWRRPNAQLFSAVLMFSVAILMPVIASGTEARPVFFGFPQTALPWPAALPRILDLDSQIGTITGLDPKAVQYLLAGR